MMIESRGRKVKNLKGRDRWIAASVSNNNGLEIIDPYELCKIRLMDKECAKCGGVLKKKGVLDFICTACGEKKSIYQLLASEGYTLYNTKDLWTSQPILNYIKINGSLPPNLQDKSPTAQGTAAVSEEHYQHVLDILSMMNIKIDLLLDNMTIEQSKVEKISPDHPINLYLKTLDEEYKLLPLSDADEVSDAVCKDAQVPSDSGTSMSSFVKVQLESNSNSDSDSSSDECDDDSSDSSENSEGSSSDDSEDDIYGVKNIAFLPPLL